MLRFFAPQRAGAAVFSVQYGNAPPPPAPNDPPPPVVTTTALAAGTPTIAAASVSSDQILLDEEFMWVTAPDKRTVMLAKTGATL